MAKQMSSLYKTQIRKIAQEMFEAGKQNIRDNQFDEYFERAYDFQLNGGKE
jgi:pyocin large subunit-like protein